MMNAATNNALIILEKNGQCSKLNKKFLKNLSCYLAEACLAVPNQKPALEMRLTRLDFLCHKLRRPQKGFVPV